MAQEASENSNGFRAMITPAPSPVYHIIGTEMQIANLLLGPKQSVDVAPGAMMHHGPSIYAEAQCNFCSGCVGRLCTGESVISIKYVNKGSEPEVIGVSPVYPAKIIPVHLDEGEVIVKMSAYMCGVGDVKIKVDCDCCSTTCCFGKMGYIRQRLAGSGVAFLQAGGTVLEKVLGEGESITVDQESLIGWSSTVRYGVRTYAGVCGCCSAMFGGEGCCMASLQGPGRIWITSMNFQKWHRVLSPNVAGSGSQCTCCKICCPCLNSGEDTSGPEQAA